MFSKKFIVIMAILTTRNTPHFTSAENLRKQSDVTFTTPAGLTLNMDDLDFVRRHLEEQYPGATFAFDDLVAAADKIDPARYSGAEYTINRGKCLFLLQVIGAKLSELKMDDHFSFVELYGPSICGTAMPTLSPITDEPTTDSPSKAPTDEPPTHKPSSPPSVGPSLAPTHQPSKVPTSSPTEGCQGNKTFSCCNFNGNPIGGKGFRGGECGSVTVDCVSEGNYNYTAINAACVDKCPSSESQFQPAVCKPGPYTCEFTCCGGGGGEYSPPLFDGDSCGIGSSNTAQCRIGFDLYDDGNPCGSCAYINKFYGPTYCCGGINALNATTCQNPSAPCYGASCGPNEESPDCTALPLGFGFCASDNGTVVDQPTPEDVGILSSGILQPGGRGGRKLQEDASYDPTPEEVMQVVDESNGDLDSEFVLQDNLLTPEECDVLVAYTDEHDGVPVSGSADQDHVIMFRKKSPLEDIIGLERAKDLYKYFKEHTNGAPVTQVWLRRLSSKSGLSMKLHTDHQPYQLKIALNGNFEGGETVVGDRTGANRIHLEPGAGILHDKGLVHGHMPHSNGDKYILFLISDANPSSMKDLAAETLALVVDASRVINDISGTEEMLN